MSVFKRFGPGDQVDNVLVLEPTWTLASGSSSGWRGSPEGSASVNLFGGYHRTPGGVVREYRFQRTIQGTDSFGTLARSEPITASVNFVYLTSEERSIAQRSATRWGYEHWKTVMGLYDYYRRRDPGYVTASYDYYSLYFRSGSSNIVVDDTTYVVDVEVEISPGVIVVEQRNYGTPPTGSFTLESWVKPFVTASAGRDFTIQSMNHSFWFGITGSTGRLVLSSSFGAVSASNAVSNQRWNHVAVAFDSTTLTGTFYVNLQHAGNFALAAALPDTTITGTMWSIGNRVADDPNAPGADTVASTGTLVDSFHGMIGENRYWQSARSWTQLSESYARRLTGSLSAEPVAYLKFNEGPLANVNTLGSGAIDVARTAQGQLNHLASLNGFTRSGPSWLPNDNVVFRPGQTFARTDDPVRRMLAVSVPASLYGRQIVPGTVRLECRAFSAPSHGLVRVLVDDSRGGLYVSGSVCSSSLAGKEDYDGVVWNKVGNVFYSEGLITVRDPALLDFAANWTAAASSHPNDLLELNFRGESRVPVKTLMCRIERGDINASLNRTFWSEEEDGDRVRRHPSGSLYVTAVGLYNSDHELVGVARLAEPLRVRPRDRMNVKLRMDF